MNNKTREFIVFASKDLSKGFKTFRYTCFESYAPTLEKNIIDSYTEKGYKFFERRFSESGFTDLIFVPERG